MSVSASPDGRMLAVDMQGSLWLIPTAGGTAKRITDYFSDARQPVWSPDGRTIAAIDVDGRGSVASVFTIDVESGATRDVPFGLSYTLPGPPAARSSMAPA